MDDVHQELIRLKQRVSEMAASYSCSPSRPPRCMTESDAFLAHIVDAKAHLDSIQASLLLNNDSQFGTRTRGGHGYTNASSRTPPSYANHFLPHRGLSLPPTPLFWSLFNSLRTDVRSLDSRVGDIEQSVSNLEDRVDRCLDPLTPVSSATDAPAEFPQQEMHEPLPAALQPKPGVPGQCSEEYTYPILHNSASSQSHQKSVELDATCNGAERFSTYGQDSPINYWPIPLVFDALAPEGVAFRDKEISNLEELNISTQDSLRRSEEASRESQSYIRELEAANAELERRLSESAECLATCSAILDDKHAEIEQVRAECRAKDAALHANHLAAYEDIRQKEDELSTAHQQLHRLSDLQGSRQKEFDEVIDAKNDELQQLRAFCESKDTVVVKQEEVIARGVVLMQQKDDEIERVSRDLKLCKDDLDGEVREKERFSRLFEERGEVVAQLRASLNHALTPKAATKRASKAPTPIHEATYSPFATSGPELHASNVIKWAPKPFRYARLPSEQQRAAIWESGPRSVSHTFGRSGWREADTRRCDSVRLLEKLALTEETSSQQQDCPRANRQKLSRASRSSGGLPAVPSDGLQPEHLPPLPPRRRISLAEIRGQSDGQERYGPITKHASMQELLRSELQPYVEAVEHEA